MPYNLNEIKNNLKSLHQYLEKTKKDNGFWVIASRNDFKTLYKTTITTKGDKVISKDKTPKINLKDIENYLLNDKQDRYKNIKIAFINFMFKDINNSDDNNIVCRLLIKIFPTDSKGKLKKDSYECGINFTLGDMKTLKLTYRDAETFMRQVADKLVLSNNMMGINYKNYKSTIDKLK